MTKINDPADKTLDAQADGQFQTVDRRAGYGDKDETLARLIRWCKEGKQLAHSEMLMVGKYIAQLEADRSALLALNDIVLRATATHCHHELQPERVASTEETTK